jgi:hypothetical protein
VWKDARGGKTEISETILFSCTLLQMIVLIRVACRCVRDAAAEAARRRARSRSARCRGSTPLIFELEIASIIL